MKLCDVLRQYRWAIRVGVRELAAEIGCSASTLSRIERGHLPDGTTLALILLWLLKKETPRRDVPLDILAEGVTVLLSVMAGFLLAMLI